MQSFPFSSPFSTKALAAYPAALPPPTIMYLLHMHRKGREGKGRKEEEKKQEEIYHVSSCKP